MEPCISASRVLSIHSWRQPREAWGPIACGANTGSVGSFLYYSEDLDLYMAGSIDQTQDNMAPILLMLRVMTAVQQLR